MVLERRPVLGGAAVTEEIVPGFKFSRCSYLLGLLRPYIVKDLELKVWNTKIVEYDYLSVLLCVEAWTEGLSEES